jgi:hypothetical protein
MTVTHLPTHRVEEDCPPGHVTSIELVHRAGITYRQLDYWTRTGLLRPTDQTHATGSGTPATTPSIRSTAPPPSAGSSTPASPCRPSAPSSTSSSPPVLSASSTASSSTSPKTSEQHPNHRRSTTR